MDIILASASPRRKELFQKITENFKIVVSKAQAYKQAGNSIVVDVMMALINEIFETGIFN